MPAFTYLSDCSIKQYSSVKDPDVNELFQEVRTIDSNWLVEENEEIRGLFKKRKIIYYRLYYNFDYEQQIIFLGEHLKDKGNKDTIMLYFYAFLNGYKTGYKNEKH